MTALTQVRALSGVFSFYTLLLNLPFRGYYYYHHTEEETALLVISGDAVGPRTHCYTLRRDLLITEIN